MKQRAVGLLIILLALLLFGYVSYERAQFEAFIDTYVESSGSCYLEDGTCLHDELDRRPYKYGYAISIALLLFGIYLAFIDRTAERLLLHQESVAKELAAAKRLRDRDEAFAAYLEGFPDEERRVLSAVRAQDGIKQNTLRIKTGMSKTGLSLLLKELEARGHVRRERDGKTNRIYLAKF